MAPVVALNYQINQHNHTLNAPWVILIHGLFGTLDNLGVIRRELEKAYRVISIDLPNHGQSPRQSSMQYSDMAKAVVLLLDQLKIKEAHFIGHSMGGKVTMEIALSHPKWVKSIIVADISPAENPPRHDAIFAGLKNVDLSNLTSRKQADDRMAEFIQEAGVRQFLLKSLYQDQGKWCWRFNLDVIENEYPNIIAALAPERSYIGPTLFIKGELSDYLTMAHQPLIAKLFPNSKANVIMGAGHWLHAEKPEQFNRICTQFLQQNC